jgi:hypothetical protein
MATRTSRKTVTFGHLFSLAGVDRALPAGSYDVVTDEELIEGLSFPAYRRLATMMLVPAQSGQASSVEMLNVDPLDLAAAQERDLLATSGKTGSAHAKVQ